MAQRSQKRAFMGHQKRKRKEWRMFRSKFLHRNELKKV